MKNVSAFLLIIRPLNVFIAGLSIALAALLAEAHWLCASVMFAVISGMLITAGANVSNDICDIAIDRINKPQRILPAGRMSVRAAQIYTIILLASGVIFSIFVGLFAAIIAASSTFLVIIYNLWLKRQPLVGNFVVSMVSALAFIFGAVAACTNNPRWQAGFFPACFAFLFHFGREIVKDIEDQAGDRAVHARTLPLAFGLSAAQAVATIAFATLLIVVLIPFVRGVYQQPYLWIVLLGVYPAILFATWQVWRHPEVRPMRAVSNLLKADMLIGVLAIWLGSQS
ncbi:geranylgeranylglycerol-phosphate geranylgeranyltransferase [candidate division KSB1 bacterium]|nr:geranylgeranylglycerol-phosphate geranylgeranyltransferase [candidate division KSB1 bacterium]